MFCDGRGGIGDSCVWIKIQNVKYFAQKPGPDVFLGNSNEARVSLHRQFCPKLLFLDLRSQQFCTLLLDRKMILAGFICKFKSKFLWRKFWTISIILAGMSLHLPTSQLQHTWLTFFLVFKLVSNYMKPLRLVMIEFWQNYVSCFWGRDVMELICCFAVFPDARSWKVSLRTASPDICGLPENFLERGIIGYRWTFSKSLF